MQGGHTFFSFDFLKKRGRDDWFTREHHFNLPWRFALFRPRPNTCNSVCESTNRVSGKEIFESAKRVVDGTDSCPLLTIQRFSFNDIPGNRNFFWCLPEEAGEIKLQGLSKASLSDHDSPQSNHEKNGIDRWHERMPNYLSIFKPLNAFTVQCKKFLRYIG